VNIEELDQWVRDRHLDYASRGIEIGDPLYEWELAHHPVPRCEGGTEMVPLLKSDHAAHGVLQSEVFQRPCIYGWEANFLTGDLLELCKKWHSEKGRNAMRKMPRESRVKVGRNNVESGHLHSISSAGGKVGSRSQIENGVGIFGASPQQKSEWGRKAAQASNPRAPWWTDGTSDKKCVECPGENWWRGRSKTRKNK
jgi:hypothetical protein